MCPACRFPHIINKGWNWNGDAEKPTFSPSILLRSSMLTDKGNSDIEAWREAGFPKRDEPFESVATVCHSFVTDGQIKFLSDCTHKFAGQTVDLMEFSQ